ncbi:MAG: creatinine amidohydrolase family protein [Ramlibacter sp.]|nr:creatinine amidohydrolase family protein [Ramlibacter sp.]
MSITPAPAVSLAVTRFWSDWTSEAFARLDRTKLIAVLPVGAIEQHGPHLPMSVDTATVDGMVAATMKRLPAELPVLFLPTQAVGKSNEHSRYPGTLTLSAETLIRTWRELGACVAAAGVRKLVLFNSHGGQESVMDIVARDLREQHGMLVICVNWYGLGLPEGLIGDEENRFGIHAGELETSILLALRPDLVQMTQARDFESADKALRASSNHLSFVEGKGLVAWQTQDLNPLGACGNAAAGTAAKGRSAIDFVADRFVQVLQEIDALPVALLQRQPAW